MAEILFVCTSDRKGIPKSPQDSVTLKENHGIIGDAHAGEWHRQVSLLAEESIAKVRAKIPDIKPGAFAENLVTQGICLYELPIGTKLKIGDAICEVTQIGKECHTGCAIKKITGDCVMPREGIFVKVLQGGEVKPGTSLEILD